MMSTVIAMMSACCHAAPSASQPRKVASAVEMHDGA